MTNPHVFFLFLFLFFRITIHAHSNIEILIRDVYPFDGVLAELKCPLSVYIEGNIIKELCSSAIPASPNMIQINGTGKTLTPVLIDVYFYMVFSSLTNDDLSSRSFSMENLVQRSSEGAGNTIMREFTTIRDCRGAIFPIQALIKEGKINGQRIWPAGTVISQTGGHGDFRAWGERSRRLFGKISKTEAIEANYIAVGTTEVLTAVHENLRFDMAFIKLMASGGIASDYDPFDVSEYMLEELKAAVEAAKDWGTDLLFNSENGNCQIELILKLAAWFTSNEILKLITHDNVQMLKLSGRRSPYQGESGLIQRGALESIILIEGNPLVVISLLTDFDHKFLVIINDARFIKYT